MNKNSIKDFRPEDGRMDKVRKVLEEEGIYMGRGDGFEIYNFGCTVFAYSDKVRIGGRLPITTLYCQSQLEEKANTKLKEIK